MTKNKSVLSWIDEMKSLVNPKDIVWIDGSEEQKEKLYKQASAAQGAANTGAEGTAENNGENPEGTVYDAEYVEDDNNK